MNSLERTSPALPRFEPLGDHHDRAAFSCEQLSLTRFLTERALRDMRARLSATHVLLMDSDVEIAGCYTLAAASIPLARISDSDRKRLKLSKYPQMSAVLIARLARDERWRGRGTGDLLMIDALRRLEAQTAHVGAAFVIVDAIDEHAAQFYESFGFLRFPDTPRQLFLPMTTVQRALGTR